MKKKSTSILKMSTAKPKPTAWSFCRFPSQIGKYRIPKARLATALEILDRELASGRNVVLHCRQGIGRTGLVAACLFLTKGLDPETAVQRLSAARGLTVPQTPEQRQWIEHYAS